MRPLTLLALAAALAATAAVFFSDHWWPFELAGHFRLHLIAASALFAIVALWRGPRWAALGLAGVAAWHAVEVSRIPFAPAAPAAAAAGPKVATVNLLWNNRSHDAVIAFLNRTDADIVVLQETTTVWSRALIALKPRYPHRYPDETQAHPGVLVLSKTPLLPNGLQVPYVAAMRVRWRDGSLLFLGVHTVLPFGEQGRAIQAKTLADIADLAARETGPVIVAGDFNHTAYTPRFARLLERGKLAPSRHPGIWPVTWRAAFADVPGLDRLFGLPIDQVLMSRHFAVRAVTIGPEVGSDHLPVVVELALRP